MTNFAAFVIGFAVGACAVILATIAVMVGFEIRGRIQYYRSKK